ncbi:MAG: glycosyltransferase family 2 protein [Selenomonadaceae bacterium]|nr:glycosyltransferase family 2 protein [Selenomonadaceae bacterium]
MPKVSIIISISNSERFIECCFDSILVQTSQDFEIIVLDNCSNDRSLKILEKYSDPRIKLFHNLRTLGDIENQNRALTLTKDSKYIFQISPSDAILPKTLETLVNAAEESQAEVVYMNSYFVATAPNFKLNNQLKVQKQLAKNPTPRFMSQNLIDRLQSEFLEHGIFNETFLRLQRRDFLLENSICLPETISNLAILLKTQRAQVIDFCGYVYRRKTESNPQNVLKDTLKNLPELIENMEKLLQNLSLENRMMIESQVIIDFLISRLMHFNLTLEKKDAILKEFFNSRNEMNPEIFRTIFESFMLFATQCSNPSPNRKSIFQLNQDSD